MGVVQGLTVEGLWRRRQLVMRERGRHRQRTGGNSHVPKASNERSNAPRCLRRPTPGVASADPGGCTGESVTAVCVRVQR